MKFFHGCTALITGASSGLGVEFARQLAPHAHALVLTARRQDRLQTLKAELTRSYPDLNVYCYVLDLADMDAVERFTRYQMCIRDRSYPVRPRYRHSQILRGSSLSHAPSIDRVPCLSRLPWS